jgi:hypothetical protein
LLDLLFNRIKKFVLAKRAPHHSGYKSLESYT